MGKTIAFFNEEMCETNSLLSFIDDRTTNVSGPRTQKGKTKSLIIRRIVSGIV